MRRQPSAGACPAARTGSPVYGLTRPDQKSFLVLRSVVPDDLRGLGNQGVESPQHEEGSPCRSIRQLCSPLSIPPRSSTGSGTRLPSCPPTSTPPPRACLT